MNYSLHSLGSRLRLRAARGERGLPPAAGAARGGAARAAAGPAARRAAALVRRALEWGLACFKPRAQAC